MSLHIQNRKMEARQRYEKILQIDPRAVVASNNLAMLYLEEGQNLDTALGLAQTAKEQLPDSPEVNDTLGLVYAKKGLGNLAIVPLELSARKDPTNPVYQYHLGLAYAQVGQTMKARAVLQDALALNAAFDGSTDARRVLAALSTNR
jgi:Flp pilus assembly protein TadD